MLDAHTVPVTSVSGQSLASFQARVGNLPVPERHYSADVFYLSVRHETLFLLFGQQRVDGAALRNLLVVKMPPDAVNAYLSSLTVVDDAKTGVVTAELLAERLNIHIEDVPAELPQEPEETVEFNANLIVIAISGREGCLDFYYASPFSKAAMVKTNKLAVDPVVRIAIPTAILVGMNRRLQTEISRMPDDLTLAIVPRGDSDV